MERWAIEISRHQAIRQNRKNGSVQGANMEHSFKQSVVHPTLKNKHVKINQRLKTIV
jgi:hypothetical protein